MIGNMADIKSWGVKDDKNGGKKDVGKKMYKVLAMNKNETF